MHFCSIVLHNEFLIYIYFYVCFAFVYICVCTACMPGALGCKKVSDPVKQSCRPPCGCWEPHADPLQEQACRCSSPVLICSLPGCQYSESDGPPSPWSPSVKPLSIALSEFRKTICPSTNLTLVFLVTSL